MTGPVVAATALAIAVLLPGSPRRRLGARTGRVRTIPGGRRTVVGLAVVCCAVAGAVGLPPAGCAAGAILAVTVGVRRRSAHLRRLASREAAAVHGALGALVAELQAGSDPVRAFTAAAAETDTESVASALRGVAARARLGADVAAGLREAAVRSALPALWNWLAVYWRLSSEHGIAIAVLMRAAQSDIAARQRFSLQMEAGMAGARASATILAVLPGLGVLLGQLIGARPMTFLLSTSGGPVAIIGVVLVCAGLLWSDRIAGRVPLRSGT